ncbi:MAG: rhodanese [Blastochloris sp.]|nr:rhodanese [Blastochloris sp.]
MNVKEIKAAELARRIREGLGACLVDVREESEWALARLPEARLIPLSVFGARALSELNTSDEIIVYCHHGVRSERASMYLIQNGFDKVSHLAGGIDAWSLEVDSSVKRY